MKRLAIIGCGLRGESYLRGLSSEMGREWALTAAADPNETYRDYVVKRYGAQDTRCYASGPELLESEGSRLDGVIIASPNRLHSESVVPAMKHHLRILLEKPVAATMEDGAAIWRAYEQYGRPPVVLGFVMRYIAFYRKLKELLAQGVVGRLLTVQADEQMGAPLTALYLRGWRRFERVAGPLIAEKCSHDMDMLRWLIDAPPCRVSSFAERTVFVPRSDAAEHCRDCRLAATCRYSIRHLQRYRFGQEADAARHPMAKEENDLCVFNGGADVPDHQTVQIAYENGTLANFAVFMDQPRTRRTIRLAGTEAHVFGDLDRDEIVVERPIGGGYEPVRTETIRVSHDASGHHGGDSVITNRFKAVLMGETAEAPAGLREGMEACALCFAAEQSRHEDRIVRVSDMRKTLFGTDRP